MILDPISNAAPGSGAIRPAAMPGASARNADPVEGGAQGESLGFFDLLDIINPLQHIPVVSTVYRQITGDEISAPARMLGGALFMGPIGFIASAFNAVADAVSGNDIGETVLAAFSGDDAEPAARQAAARANEAPSASEAPSAIAASSAPSSVMIAAAEAPGPTKGLFFQEMAAKGRVLPAVATVTPAASDQDDNAPANAGFHGAMMDGLRKYEVLLQQRQAAQQTAGSRLDATF